MVNSQVGKGLRGLLCDEVAFQNSNHVLGFLSNFCLLCFDSATVHRLGAIKNSENQHLCSAAVSTAQLRRAS